MNKQPHGGFPLIDLPILRPLIVDDPNAVFDQAVAADPVVRSPMQNHEYGWRDGLVVDPLGHRWEIG